MSYQFYNNWPYGATGFPTMIDHQDYVNHAYFDGLHQELENIETELGLDPAGEYDTVKERLDAGPIGGRKMTSIICGPILAVLPSSNPAEVVKLEETNHYPFYVAKFDQSTEESISFVVPVSYRLGTESLRIKLYGRCNATSGTARFNVEIFVKADDDAFVFTGSPTYTVQVDMTAKAVANYLIVNYSDIAAADIVELKNLLIRIVRKATDTDDDLAVDFEFLALKIEEI